VENTIFQISIGFFTIAYSPNPYRPNSCLQVASCPKRLVFFVMGFSRTRKINWARGFSKFLAICPKTFHNDMLFALISVYR